MNNENEKKDTSLDFQKQDVISISRHFVYKKGKTKHDIEVKCSYSPKEIIDKLIPIIKRYRSKERNAKSLAEQILIECCVPDWYFNQRLFKL